MKEKIDLINIEDFKMPQRIPYNNHDTDLSTLVPEIVAMLNQLAMAHNRQVSNEEGVRKCLGKISEDVLDKKHKGEADDRKP